MASVSNSKAKKWVLGRKNWQQKVRKALSKLQTRPIWIHVSSVGEFEQGQPVLQALKSKYSNTPIVLTFFSPSGYEQLHKTSGADFVFYLPIDSASNAKRFLGEVNPQLALFIKYEFWYFYFNELNKRKIPFALISAKLRPDQFFFKWYGKAYQNVLHKPTHFFVQDIETQKLLSNIGQNQVTVCGDTRIDRILSFQEENKSFEIIERFVGQQSLLIVGSAWKTEIEFISKMLNAGGLQGWKVIVAPHEIESSRINEIEKSIDQAIVRYTDIEKSNEIDQNVDVLVLNCIGVLKHIYKYAKIAFVGGGFYDGIHNIIEPASVGAVPVFGPMHKKFPEAKQLINCKGGFEVANYSEFAAVMDSLKKSEVQKTAAKSCKNYVNQSRGATEKVIEILNTLVNVK